MFDKFEVIDCLKKDTHSSVYLANHIYLGKKIILKTLNTDNLPDKTILERFKREAKILAQLDHPNLIKVLDFGTFKNHFYISFEHFESRNLRVVIKENNLSNEVKKSILIQLFKALNIAHQNQIIHRDIKPENILLNGDYHLKIADFGLALVSTDNNITQDSSIVGTPSYMSPEQLRGEKTLQTDLFSSGIVAYELYTGKNPLGGETISDTINKIVNYSETNDFFNYELLPDEVRPAIKNMLKKNLKERVKTSLEVLKLLGVEDEIYEPVKISVSKKYFKYSYAAIIILLVVIIVAYVYNSQMGKNNNPPAVNGMQSGETNLIPQGSSQVDNKNSIGQPDNVINETRKNEKTTKTNGTIKATVGRFFVECQPWADVYIDGKKVDTTPLKDYLELKTGSHILTLVHNNYPPFVEKINISPYRIETVTVDFKKLVGFIYVDCYPWGEVFINGKLKGTTPLREPIALFKGDYHLTVYNTKYDSVSTAIKITANDTTKYFLNFETMDKLIPKGPAPTGRRRGEQIPQKQGSQ